MVLKSLDNVLSFFIYSLSMILFFSVRPLFRAAIILLTISQISINVLDKKINFAKSNIFFHRTLHSEITICPLILFQDWGFQLWKYLGSPIFTSRSIKRHFQFLIDNFKTRLAWWKIKFLSLIVHATLTRSTLNSLRNHIMQYISIPSYIIRRLKSLQNVFVWGSTDTRRRLHLVKWDIVT